MPNAWDRVGTPQGRDVASRVLVVVGAVLLLLAVLAVVAYRTFLDTDSFAAGVDEIRKTEAVSDALGRELATQIVAGAPDLVAVRPLIEQVSAEVAGSNLLSPLVVRAAAQAQRAATEENSAAIVLRLADAGAVATSALAAFAPDVAAQIPPDLSVTLAEIGGQDVLASTVRASRYLSIAAWALPLLALGTLALAVWIRPNQRRGLVRVGIATMVVGGVLGVLTLAVGIVTASLDATTLTGALADGAWQVWSQGFWTATAVLLVAGAVVAAAAAALIPDVDVRETTRAAWQRVGARPRTTEGIALRGTLIALVGLGLVLEPVRLLTWGAVLAGLLVLVYGVSEVTQAAVGARQGEPAQPADPETSDGNADTLTTGWSLGLLVAGVAVVLGAGAFWAVRSVDTDPATASAVTVGTGEVCNGHASLCERRYDEVSYMTTHNAMSAADEPGWFLAEQPHGLISQLDGGARAAMIDVWAARPSEGGVSSLSVNLDEGRTQLEEAFGASVVDSALRVVEAVVGEPTGPEALYMCHGLCEIGATELAPTLGSLRAWLDTNPDEVVSLIVENHVPATEIGQAFVDAGLEPSLHTVVDGEWPTLAQMITSGRRLVVMTEEGSGGDDYPWLRNAFALTQDTPYTFPTPDDFSCEPNRGPADAPLLLVNHWLSGFGNLVTAAQTVNVIDVLGSRVEQCEQERGLQPTFVGVNFYDIGDVAAVVDDLNGVG
ncbi:MAG: hypothetical protein WCA29_15460 [Jiangellales bacterium]